jgi:tetratricopeptide (TPR) repeat protein
MSKSNRIQYKLLTAATVVSMFSSVLVPSVANAHEYEALIKAKKYVEVDRAATTKLSAEPNNADALVVKTELILIEGKDSRLDEAAKLAEQCIAAHPKNSECHEALGNVLGTKATRGGFMSAMGYVGKIRDSFQMAVELDPKNFSARNSLMEFYLQAPGIVGGGTSKAKNFIIETNKVNSVAGALLQASLDLKDEKYDKAEAAVLTANIGGVEALASMHRNVMSKLGHGYVNAKRFSDGERIFHEFSLRYPDNAAGFYGMGKALQEQGKIKEAIPQLEKSIVLEASAFAYYRIGKCWQTLSEKTKAVAAFEKALSFKPELSSKIKSDAEDQLKMLR